MNYKQTPITWEIPRVSGALSQQPRVKLDQFSVIQRRYMQGGEHTKQQADTEDALRACAVLSAPCTARRVCRGHESARKQEQAGIETEGQRDGEREKQEGGRHRGRRDGKGQKDFSSIYRRLSPRESDCRVHESHE